MNDILLIDDDEIFHELFAAYIRDLNCNILHAFDGQEGERMALLHKPLLIVIDIMMPGQDGYTTCSHLRAQDYRGAIALTSSLHEATSPKNAQAWECGANAYIAKPPNSTVLDLYLEYARSDMKYPTVAEWFDHRQ